MPKLHFVSRKLLRDNGLRWDPIGANKPNQHLSSRTDTASAFNGRYEPPRCIHSVQTTEERVQHPRQPDGEPPAPASDNSKIGKGCKRSTNETTIKFSDRLAELDSYKEKYGHLDVRQSRDKSLADFSKNVRHARKSLDALGFDWITKRSRKPFSQRLEDLRAFKEEHGHVNVRPRDDNSLDQFCKTIRQARSNPGKDGPVKLTEDHIASLDSLGFDWTQSTRTATPFEKRINELRLYKQKHGHVNVKRREDKSLAQFCASIKHAYRNIGKAGGIKLTHDRIASLDALGFVWPNTSSFGNRTKKAHKEKHGHLSVSRNEGKSLADFSFNIRQARKNVGKEGCIDATQDRNASLDALGFDRKPRARNQVPFERRIEQLKAYKEKHGHLNVTQNEDKKLAAFCHHIRFSRRNPEKRGTKLTDDRIASLDALGFDWTHVNHRMTFEERIEQLRAYKEKHGHLSVTRNEDKGLYHFSVNIRQARKNAGITDDRIASLDALGFDWILKKGNQMPFERRIEQLKAYKEKHGHFIVGNEDKSLAKFCNSIRKGRRNPEKSSTKLTDDRIASLDALGFDWILKKGNQMPFERRIEQLKAYKEKHGHLNVTQNEDKKLAAFCHHIRFSRRNPEKRGTKLTDDRIASLDALGFDWKTFEERIEQLRVHKEKHGQLNVTRNEDKSLAQFCSIIRRERKNAGRNSFLKMTNGRVASLNALGFDWSLKESDKTPFEDRIDQLKAYKEKHGHLNVTQNEDKKLAAFCHHIRFSRRNPEKRGTKLTDDRIASLDALGFQWDLSDVQSHHRPGDAPPV